MKTAKPGRNEHLQHVVGNYLHKRQYSDLDTFKKDPKKLNQTSQQMALASSVLEESSKPNAVSFSSISGDVAATDHQFTRLKVWIGEAVEPCHSELTYLLFPLFCHLYLELVQNGQKMAAQKFHKRHHVSFMLNDDYRGVVDELVNVTSIMELQENVVINDFRSSRYKVKLSEWTLHYLLCYLYSSNHVMLLQIFNNKLEVQVEEATTKKLHLYVADDYSTMSEEATAQGKKTEKKSSECGDEQMKRMLEVIKKVREGPPSLPSICLYQIMNAYSGLCSVSISRDSMLLAGGFENSSLRLWSLLPQMLDPTEEDSQISRIRLACDIVDADSAETRTPSEMQILRGHSGAVFAAGFTPGSDYLISCSSDTTVRAWSLRSYSNVVIYRGHNYPVWCLDVNLGGQFFVTGSQDRTAKLWNMEKTYPVRMFSGHSQDVDSVKFHPNGNYLATGSVDKTVRLWSVAEGKLVRVFPGHKAAVFALAFSPNGQYLASAGEDRRIKIWDLAGGSMLRELRGHTDSVYSMAWDIDGSLLASCGMDCAVRLWEFRRGSYRSDIGDNHTSPELLGVYSTQCSSLQLLHYSAQNTLLCVGAGLPER